MTILALLFVVVMFSVLLSGSLAVLGLMRDHEEQKAEQEAERRAELHRVMQLTHDVDKRGATPELVRSGRCGARRNGARLSRLGATGRSEIPPEVLAHCLRDD